MFNSPIKASPLVTVPSKPIKEKKKKASLVIDAAVERIAAEVPKPSREQPYVFMRKIYTEFLELWKSPHWNIFLKRVSNATPQKKDQGS